MSALPRPLHTSEMTFWSRYDPISQPRGNTDHWAKLKLRAVQSSRRRGGDMSGVRAPGTNYYPSYNYEAQKETEQLAKHVRNDVPWLGDRPTEPRIPAVPETAVSDSYQASSYIRRKPKSASYREKFNTSFNKKAKEGFKYWLITKPPPTTFGRYGIGSHKTVLGIGNAIRT